MRGSLHLGGSPTAFRPLQREVAVRQWIRSHLTYANVMVTILAFVVLGGGTALASYVVSSNSQIGPNTVSGHKPPSGDHANVIAGSVNGQDVADNSLHGADIAES